MTKVSFCLTYICLVISSTFLNGSQPSVDTNGTVTVAVIYKNQPLQWTRQQILQATLNQLKLKSSLLKNTEFLFHYVSGSNLRSINQCLKLISEELLPRDVQTIIITLDDFESQLVSQWASLIDIPVLGTSRNIILDNKKKYKDYHYLLPSLSEESTVLLRILTIMGVNTFGIISRDEDQGNLEASKLKNESDKLYLKPLIFNLRQTNEEYFKVEVIKVLVKLELHPVRVIVCVCDKGALMTILDVARELRLLSEKYLWVFTERMMKYFHHISSNLFPERMLGIRLNVTDDVIGLRAAHLILDIAELKLQNNGSTCNTSIPHFSSCKEYSTENALRNINLQPPRENNYDIVGRSVHHISSTSFRVIANLTPTKEMSNIGKARLLKEYHMDDMTNQSQDNRLQIVTIEHGQYTYQLLNVSPKCPSNRSPCKAADQTCEVGIPCTKYIPLGNNTFRSERICVAGLMIELLNLLHNDLQFTFDIYIVKDSKYGGYDSESGRWNGMIGDIIRGKADMALATLTTTSARSRVVDFSFPYGEVGIGLLTSAVNQGNSKINLDFLLPFSVPLWIVIVCTIVTVWTLIWVLDKTSAQWHLKGREGVASNKKKVLFLESMSFAWSTFVHVQAGRGLPQSHSARFVALFFALAMLIVSASYTAELAAHKVKEEVKQTISGIFDEKMLNPPENFKYGTLKDSSTEAFFKFSEDPRLRQIYENMKSNIVDRVEDGVKKLINGEFQVYIDDQPYLEHLVSSRLNCSLRVIDNTLGTSGYALALKKNSKWTSPFSLSIMKLNDQNILRDLWAKWLKRKCISKEEFGKLPSGLTIENVNGLFLAIAAGIGVGLVSLLIENAISFLRRTKQKNIDVMECQTDCKGNTWSAGSDSVARDLSIRGVQLLRHYTNKAFSGSNENVGN